MSIEGLWTASMSAPGEFGAGVIVFETGRVFGGDSSMYYTGSYQVDGGKVTGWLRVRKHHHVPQLVPFAGMDDAEFEIRATIESDKKMKYVATVISPKTGKQVLGELNKLDELPG